MRVFPSCKMNCHLETHPNTFHLGKQMIYFNLYKESLIYINLSLKSWESEQLYQLCVIDFFLVIFEINLSSCEK